jgi:sugar (pentulose or hexulose) kinase
VNRFIEVKNTFHHDKENKEIYDELFETYKDIYHNLKKTYIKANAKRFSKKST